MDEKENIFEIAARRKLERDDALEEIQDIKEAIHRYLFDHAGVGEFASYMDDFKYREQ